MRKQRRAMLAMAARLGIAEKKPKMAAQLGTAESSPMRTARLGIVVSKPRGMAARGTVGSKPTAEMPGVGTTMREGTLGVMKVTTRTITAAMKAEDGEDDTGRHLMGLCL